MAEIQRQTTTAMIKLNLYILVLILPCFLWNCSKGESEKRELTRTNEQVEIEENRDTTSSTNQSVPVTKKVSNDVKKPPGKLLEEFQYPIKSRCGGAVTAFYDNDELVKIISVQFGEFKNYNKRTIRLESGKPISISVHEHHPDYAKYSKNHSGSGGIQPEKLTYTDTTHILKFSDTISYGKYGGGRLISTELDNELLNRLLKCIEIMKSELNTEREASQKEKNTN